MENTVNAKIRLFAEYKAEIDALTEKKMALQNEIIASMMADKVKKIDDDVNTCTLCEKMTIKYTDEPFIIDYLKTNGMDNYLVTAIDTKAFNKSLKESVTLQKSFDGKYEENISQYIKVASK